MTLTLQPPHNPTMRYPRQCSTLWLVLSGSNPDLFGINPHPTPLSYSYTANTLSVGRVLSLLSLLLLLGLLCVLTHVYRAITSKKWSRNQYFASTPLYETKNSVWNWEIRIINLILDGIRWNSFIFGVKNRRDFWIDFVIFLYLLF